MSTSKKLVAPAKKNTAKVPAVAAKAKGKTAAKAPVKAAAAKKAVPAVKKGGAANFPVGV